MISDGLKRICAFIFVVAGVAALPIPAMATMQTSTGSVDVGSVVPGPPPAGPPTIDTPLDAAHVTDKNIPLAGTCTAGLTVKIYRNAVFAGSAVCGDGRYGLNVDMVEGRNDLIGRQYDALDQSSPDSDTSTVYFLPESQAVTLPDAKTSPTDTRVARFQLVIDYTYNFQNVGINSDIHLPIHFSGGSAPYAVSVSWGDGTVELFSRSTPEQFFVSHAYKTAGNFSVKIRVTDSAGTAAFLQFAMRINGAVEQANFLGIPLENAAKGGLLPLTWPTIAFSISAFGLGIIISRFWPMITKAIARMFLTLRK